MSRCLQDVSVSVVIPLYNEEEILPKTVDCLLKFLSSRFRTFRIILSNDGSSDSTLRVAQSLAASRYEISVVSIASNCGRGAAIARSMRTSDSEVQICYDADMEIGVAVIDELVTAIVDGADIAIASKFAPASVCQRSWYRNVAHRIYLLLIRLFLGLRVRDPQGGVKAFRADIVNIFPRMSNARWLWDTELIARAVADGYRVVEVPTHSISRRQSRVHFLSTCWASWWGIILLAWRGVRVGKAARPNTATAVSSGRQVPPPVR